MKLVSIVILNWNGKRYLEQFLPALVQHSSYPGAEIVVADNGSDDGSLSFLNKEYPAIRIIELGKNFGFSGGYNRALEQVDASYVLLLNSDIEVTEGWLEPLLEQMQGDSSVAACTPKILDFKRKTFFEYAGAAGGYLDRYGYPFCRGRIFDHLEEDRGQYNHASDIFWGSGACLMIRTNLYRESGGLDEQFFAHMEEIDLCWRLQRMGYRIRFVPSSRVYHVGGATLQRENPFKTFLNFRNNLLLLYKNLPAQGRGRTLFIRMVLDGISALRFLFRGAFKDFGAVVRAHLAFYGMKSSYKGMKNKNKYKENRVIVSGIYPGSIVLDFFLKNKRKFSDLDQQFRSL
ncbi:MAG: glycosyltransferase family 2 protein [Bacteroidales bacterium]|nr:glycosyltransferase family 2 protein [Bacteroidales bacterium]